MLRTGRGRDFSCFGAVFVEFTISTLSSGREFPPNESTKELLYKDGSDTNPFPGWP